MSFVPTTLASTLSMQCKPWEGMVCTPESYSHQGSPSTTRSRSTSAGSSALNSDGKSSAAHTSTSPLYLAESKELPEYDYPTPFIVEHAPSVSEHGHPIPAVVKLSLFDRLRKPCEIKSCPPRMISAPPGLEDEINVNAALLPQSVTISAVRASTSACAWHLEGDSYGVSKFMNKAGNLPAGKNQSESYETHIDAPYVHPKIAHEFQGFDNPASTSFKHISGLPEIDYPSHVVIKNTFINTDVWQPSSLDNFYMTRQIRSCPASGIGAPPGLEGDVAKFQSRSTTIDSPTSKLQQAAATCVSQASSEIAEPQSDSRSGLNELPPQVSHPSIVAPTLRLSEILTPPAIGSAEPPSVGSTNHIYGTCKPCAFVHTKGCISGAQCPFCHLCLPGELRRRQKNKKAHKLLASVINRA